MVRLSVNINKVALIRNSRGANFPDLIKVAQDCEKFGAEGITVHPRPDERHVRYADLEPLKRVTKTEFNIEGYPSERFLNLVCQVKPDQCTLVPDPPEALTSNTGWDTNQHQAFLRRVVKQLQAEGIRVSLFLDPRPELIESAQSTGTDRIELYTGSYALNFSQDKKEAVTPHRITAQHAQAAGIGINAGHDLNLENLSYYAQEVPGLLEVSIGHALIVDALYMGYEKAIGRYLDMLR
ncbi:MAG: pyridoxine 5'-phosphate synthase [Saprospiraceae bacterium]|nr:pyridoxine 5'-phosphate synthase [Saprospiraceae bacterium]